LHCYFIFLLINDVRMTTFTHQLLSRKTSTPRKSVNASANIPAVVLYCVRRYVAHGLCRSRFHSIRRKVRHHV